MSRPSRFCALVLGVLLIAGCASEMQLEMESEKQFQVMRDRMLIATDASTRAYVTCVTRAIVAELDEPYRDMLWDVEVFEEDATNAFAMPGGKIGVFTGIFKAAQTPDQFAAVMGHEVAHVTEKHSLERARRDGAAIAGIQVASAAAGGGYAGAGQTAYDLLLSRPFSRGAESEADRVGLLYMADAGFDPRASVQLWKNMDEVRDGALPPQFLSTHPSPDNRISRLIEALPEALARYNAARAAGKNPQCSP